MTEDGNPEDDGTTPLYRRVPWRRIASIAGVVLLVVIVVPFVVHMAPQLVGGDHSYVVLSGSMEPSISPGDVIIVGSVDPGQIRSGDVITFRRSSESRPTTHRVVEVVERDSGLAFRTQGDNNEDPDPELVPSEQVVGTVLTVEGHLLAIPLVGRVIMFAGTRAGFLLLGLLPIGLLVLSEIWNVVTTASVSDVENPTRDGSDTDRATDVDISEEDASDPSTEGETESGIAFSATELRFGLAVLVVFLGYSGWVAYAIVEPWAIGVTGAVGAGVLLTGGLFVFGGGSTTDESDDDLSDGSPNRTEDAFASTPETTDDPIPEPPGDLVDRLLEADPSTTGDDSNGDGDVTPESQGQTGGITRVGGGEDDD